MIWIGVAVAVAVVLAVGAALLKRAHPRGPSETVPGGTPARELTDADRVRHIAPAAPMVGLEAALDGVTDGQGRTLREQLDAETSGIDQLRVEDDTSPILRRALDHVTPVSTNEHGESTTNVPTDNGD